MAVFAGAEEEETALGLFPAADTQNNPRMAAASRRGGSTGGQAMWRRQQQQWRWRRADLASPKTTRVPGTEKAAEHVR
ncbi:hypothetical protein MRX96_051399 [Rhipicephalus microplus]